MTAEITLYERVGGQKTFEILIDHFYEGVGKDEVLRPMYPSDLTDARRHLMLFFTQYFGGPRTYEQERGHPRLRMRHAPFRIGERERDHWLKLMLAAIDAAQIDEPSRSEIVNYVSSTANFLMNVPANITLQT